MEHERQLRDACFALRFWGVRGSTPTPVVGNLGYGGNTPCVSVESGPDELLIFDAGSGIRALGAEIMRRTTLPKLLHIFFTHFHWDHVQGLPFFAPLYREDMRVVFHSAREAAELRAILGRQMATPFFPVDFGALPSQVEFRQIANEPIGVSDCSVQGFPLHHPQGAQGYRITDGRKSIVLATDHEHGDLSIDGELRRVARDADVLIYDAQYTPAEYSQRKGWGHGTWQEATNVARDAQVGKLILFHHDPDHDDGVLDGIVAEAQQQFSSTTAARENTTI